MAKQLGKLKMLPENKTVVFWSPIEGEDVLVRTGTITEGSCFVAGTNVYTREGSKPIEKVKIGDEVVTHTGKVQKVVQLHENPLGDRRIHEISICNTPTILVTNNHNFWGVRRSGYNKYTEPHWIEASKLDNNCYVMIPNCKQPSKVSNIKITERCDVINYEYEDTNICFADIKENPPCNTNWIIDENFCFFLGLWLSDSYISFMKKQHDSSITVDTISFVTSIQNFKISDFMANQGRNMFGIEPCISINDKQKTITVLFNNVIVAETFVSLFGNKYNGETLPLLIHQLDSNLVQHFIAGLITSYGGVEDTFNISFRTTKTSLVNELYHLARSHGLVCSTFYGTNENGKQTGCIKFSQTSIIMDRLLEYFPDEHLEFLSSKFTGDKNNNDILHINGNTYLNVLYNTVSGIKPEYVYTLGVDNDHSYAVEGVMVQNCFFHSILYAYSKEYISMDKKERMTFVRRLRASLAGKVDRDNWENMGGGLIAKIPFQENVNFILTNFYHFLNSDSRAQGRATKHVIKKLVGKNSDDLDVYKIISDLIPIQEGFEHIILPTAYMKSEEGKIADCCDVIISETIDYLNKKEEIKSIDKEKADYVRGIVRKLLITVLQEAENITYKNFIKGLENVSENVDTYTSGLISDRFKRDIYFLDGNDRMPYNNFSTNENLKGRKSIIILWIGGNHYEIVGRLLPGNRIQREFSHDDPLIQKLYTFLMKPDDVHEKYPELVSYLPKEYRKRTISSSQRFTDTEGDSDLSPSYNSSNASPSYNSSDNSD